jgi:hypothetical protein
MEPPLAIRVVPSAALSADEWSTLTDLCVAAFNEPWDDYWESIGPGVHVIAEEAGRIVAHAAIVDRLLYPGDLTLRGGYVERHHGSRHAHDPRRSSTSAGRSQSAGGPERSGDFDVARQRA